MRGRGYAEFAAALPAARLGRARSGGDLESVLGAAEALAMRRRARAPSAIGITNQRETTCSGIAPPAARCTTRSCGRTGARPSGARAAGRADPRAHGARPRSVLLGDEARVAARASTDRDGARVRHRRHVAALEADRRRRPRDRRDERVAHALCRSRAGWDDELLELFGVPASCSRDRPSGADFGEGDAARR